MQLLSINVRIGTTFVMHAVSPRDFSNCELRQLFASHTRTHIRTLDFRPHANRTHMCVLPKIHFTPAHAHLWQKGHFEANLAHKSPKLSPFLPKNVRNYSHTSHTWNRPHASTSHARFESFFARTSHMCERARTCARANFFSQLTDWQIASKVQ